MSGQPVGPDRPVFGCGPARITLDALGAVLDVRHEEWPELAYLAAHAGSGPARGRPDGAGLAAGGAWRALETRRDVDEYEVVAESVDPAGGPRLRRVLRHGFTSGWTTRAAWTHDSPRAVLLDDLAVEFAAGPGCLIWGLAAGQDTSCAVLPVSTPGTPSGRSAPPVLGGRLRRGSGAALGPDGLTLGPVLLLPGEQVVVQWEWDWYATPADYARNHHTGVPWALSAWHEDAIALDTGPDTVLLLNGRPVEQEDGLPYEVEGAGTTAVERRSARGTTMFTLSFVPSLDELITFWIDDLLRRPRGPAGVAALPGTAPAVLLQNGMVRSRGGDSPDAEDALDAFIARRLDAWSDADADAGGVDPLLAMLFASAAWRTDDAVLFDAAAQVLLAPTTLRAGAGLALLDLSFAWWARNQQPASWTDRPLRDRLAELYDHRDRADRSCAAVAASVEAALVLGRRPDPDDLRTLGEWLGAGLVGGPAVPVDPVARAEAVAAVRLLPESEASMLIVDWNCSLADLARRAAPEVVRDVVGTRLIDGVDHPTAERIDDAARALVFLEFSRS